MLGLCGFLALWAIFATFGMFYNRRSALDWRTRFMIERGCNTLETRRWMSDTKSKPSSAASSDE